MYLRGTGPGAAAVRFLEENRIEALTFEGAGHFPMLETSDDFYTRLDRWITSL